MMANREMKNSGIPWIGDIPKEWDVCLIKQIMRNKSIKGYPNEIVLSLYRDYGVIPKDSRSDNHNVTSEDTSSYKFVEVGDFVINKMKAWQGSMAVSNYQGIISPAYYICRFTTNEIDRKYIHYLLRNDTYKAEYMRLSSGMRVGQWDLNIDDFLRIRMLLPSLSEQKKIASFLDRICAEIDEMITLQEKIVEELKAYRQSKVKELFDTYMATETFTILKLGAMASLVTKQTGFDYSNTISHALVGELSENTIPYLQTKHFKDGYWNYNTDYYIPKDVAVRFPKILLNKKSLLFSIVGASIGNVAVFPATTTAFLGGAICKVDLIKERDYEYIKHFMMSIYGQEQISSKINSSAQGTITVQNVRDFKIPMFDNPNVQNAITEEVSLLGDRISSLIAIKLSKIDSLKEYKKSIIYEYVTGKKEVTE